MLTRAAASNRTPNASPNNTTGKRVLSPQSSATNNSSNSKKSKTSKMSSKEFDELKNLICALSNNIVKKIDDSHQALKSDFSALAAQVNGDVQSLRTTVNEFQTKIASDIDSVKLQLNKHADRLDNTEDDIQRVQLSQDVRIVGFAVKENENLCEIFRKVADEIGFACGENTIMPAIERMSTKNHTTGQMVPSPTIIIHFASLRQKQLFYSLYLNKMPLKPAKFGLSDDSRIIIGENLTKKNAQLFKSAQMLRKNNKIAQTFTENGIVKIRFAKGKTEKTFTVRNQIELESIVAQYEVWKSTANASNSQTHEPSNSNATATNAATNTHTSEPATIVDTSSTVHSSDITTIINPSNEMVSLDDVQHELNQRQQQQQQN